VPLTVPTTDDNTYVVVVHYYQPDVVGFDVDVTLTSLSHSYAGQFNLHWSVHLILVSSSWSV